MRWPLMMSCFNPRARVGRDPIAQSVATLSIHVSIHAPAWGATFERRKFCQSTTSFNPRARVGRDKKSAAAKSLLSSFNPRARVGRDDLKIYYKLGNHEFQSTRPRGARLFTCSDNRIFCLVSIHAPAWGATPTTGRSSIQHLVSIHAPAWGATFARRKFCQSTTCFNPRARVGRDVDAIDAIAQDLRFNPRARVGRDRFRSASSL